MANPRQAALAAILAKVHQGHAQRLQSKLPKPPPANHVDALGTQPAGGSPVNEGDEVLRKLKASMGG